MMVAAVDSASRMGSEQGRVVQVEGFGSYLGSNGVAQQQFIDDALLNNRAGRVSATCPVPTIPIRAMLRFMRYSPTSRSNSPGTFRLPEEQSFVRRWMFSDRRISCCQLLSSM
jgi:hypothetical protein